MISNFIGFIPCLITGLYILATSAIPCVAVLLLRLIFRATVRPDQVRLARFLDVFFYQAWAFAFLYIVFRLPNVLSSWQIRNLPSLIADAIINTHPPGREPSAIVLVIVLALLSASFFFLFRLIDKKLLKRKS